MSAVDSVLQILEAANKLGEAGWEYAMEASFIEVYNETLRDLLAEGRSPRDAGKVLDNNAIKHMADGVPSRPHCYALLMFTSSDPQEHVPVRVLGGVGFEMMCLGCVTCTDDKAHQLTHEHRSATLCHQVA